MDIVEKIKKLIALGTNNTNESEMAAALAKAAELALRNNLDIEQIKNESEDSGDDVGMFPVDDKPAASLSGAKRILWTNLADIFGSEVVIRTTRCGSRKRFEVLIVAPKGLRETIIYLGTYLERMMLDKWKRDKGFILSMPSGLSDDTRRERYMRGFAVGVCQKTRRIFSSQVPDAEALVLSHREKVLNFANAVAPQKSRRIKMPDFSGMTWGEFDNSHIVGHAAGLNTDIHKALGNMEQK